MYTKTQWVDNTTPINETNLNKIESGIKNNDINIGEENYDNTKTYEVGDIVRYNEKIYKCITAITTAENFDISKWEQTNIVEIVQSEKSKIYELIEALSTPIVGEGENITLNDTAEKRFENFDIEGNSEQETRSGKNYLNMFTKYKAGDTTTINGIKFTFNKDGSITCDGTASADATLDFSIPDSGQKINGTDKKLVGLIDGEYSYTKVIQFIVYDGNWGNTKAINLASANKNSTQVIADNIEYSRFRVIIYKDTVINNRTLYLQVLDALQEDLSYEQYGTSPSPDYPSEVESCGDNGSINEVIDNGLETTDTNYQSQSYTIPTQQPMRAIGNVRDKFILKENGKWYERHFIARKILDGTENWFTSVNSQFELSGTNYKKYKDGGTCISSHFIYSMELDTCVWIGNSSFILIRDTRYTNVNDWKSYLAEQYANGTPVYVDYVLATPTDIECTLEQTEILNQMYIKAKTYKGVTHMYSTDNVSPVIDVTYKKDIETLFANTLVEGV